VYVYVCVCVCVCVCVVCVCVCVYVCADECLNNEELNLWREIRRVFEALLQLISRLGRMVTHTAEVPNLEQ